MTISHEGDDKSEQEQERDANSCQYGKMQRTVQEKFPLSQFRYLLFQPRSSDVALVDLAEVSDPLRDAGNPIDQNRNQRRDGVEHERRRDRVVDHRRKLICLDYHPLHLSIFGIYGRTAFCETAKE
ncbi:hypothetical protein ASC90_25105 [Rhizobium sp. Root1220]|nr:hypothetical protein ASC90_25105 [Rhizobium sp. Root1220]